MDGIDDVVGGRFRLRAELDRGGMTHVFDAHDEDRDAPAAIHVIAPPWSAHGGGIRILRRVAAAAATMRHPGLVDALEMGILEDGRPWFATERVEAVTLADLAKKGALEPAVVACVVADLAAALDAAHASGLCHHRIKAEKAFVLMGSSGQPR